jgi:hypothetical protein
VARAGGQESIQSPAPTISSRITTTTSWHVDDQHHRQQPTIKRGVEIISRLFNPSPAPITRQPEAQLHGMT